MHHESASPHPPCPTLMPATRHDRRIGIDLAEMLRNIPVAAVPHLDIEALHTALHVAPHVEDVPTPLAPLPIKAPEFVLRPPPAMVHPRSQVIRMALQGIARHVRGPGRQGGPNGRFGSRT